MIHNPSESLGDFVHIFSSVVKFQWNSSSKKLSLIYNCKCCNSKYYKVLITYISETFTKNLVSLWLANKQRFICPKNDFLNIYSKKFYCISLVGGERNFRFSLYSQICYWLFHEKKWNFYWVEFLSILFHPDYRMENLSIRIFMKFSRLMVTTIINEIILKNGVEDFTRKKQV